MRWSTIPSGAGTAYSALMGAALGAFLAYRFNRSRDCLELKRDALRRVVAYRWHLTGTQEPASLGLDPTAKSVASARILLTDPASA